MAKARAACSPAPWPRPAPSASADSGQATWVSSTGDATKNCWDAAYVPLNIERQPFLIGRHGDELNIHVDIDHPRVSRTEGQELFLPHGGTSPYLERIHSVLLTLHQGLQAMPAFVAALTEHALLESFVADIELHDGSQHRLAGFYTINEERLQALPGAALERLQRAGHLEPIYMVLASLSKFRDLIARRERRHAA
jgi:hypothetical protein